MTGRIVTVRHGRPHVDRDVRITARQYADWWANYDKSGLAPDQVPPDDLCAIAEDCDIIVCSTMPRAIETASKLVNGSRIIPQDSIFVEAPLPPPPIPFLKLSPTMWGRISRAFWFLGYAPDGCESHARARKRVRRVTDTLVGYAERGDDVMLAAHGYLNWMIDAHIQRRGWQKIEHVGNNDFWSYRRYAPAARDRAPSRQRQPIENAASG